MSQDLNELVGEWTTLPDIATETGKKITVVRQWLRDDEIVALRTDHGSPLLVPAAFIDAADMQGPVKSLGQVIRLLRDHRFEDLEIVEWLFTPDETLPGSTPMNALRENRGTEVKRRAQAAG